MITYFESKLQRIAIHKVGNKQEGGSLQLSDSLIEITDGELESVLMKYFLGSFQDKEETFEFVHATGEIELNEVYNFTSEIFRSPKSFYKCSVNLAKHLFDISNHPNIKEGEIIVTYFKDVLIHGMLKNCVGIFKNESKVPFLRIRQKGKQFSIDHENNGINVSKVDKACLIFEADFSGGPKVMVIDNTNKSEAFYWIDQYLKLQTDNSSYSKTKELLNLYKNFVTNELEVHYEIEKADKIEMLNRSLDYFKTREHFDESEFLDEVVGDPKVIKIFKGYKKEFEKEADVTFGSSFDISSQAVRHQSRKFKSVLKLDKNFHIYIHGDRQLIEKGFDKTRNMNYYKVYFSEEN
jgi:hypothetical protein